MAKTKAGRNGAGRTADVLFAPSETSMDLLWATRFPAPDPYPFFRIGKRKYLVASDLEIGRARRTAEVHQVVPLSRWQNRLTRAGVRHPDFTDVLVAVLQEKGVAVARVPHDFPVYTADRLRAAGIEVTPVPAPFWPERIVKTPEEIEAIRDAARHTGEAIGEGIELIRRAKPVRGVLRLDGRPLTSERVRAAIDDSLAQRGFEARHTIVAGGEQAVDPHDRGSGPLPAGYPVIIDCFPRSATTGFHADISRTVFRGRPRPEHLRMWEAVHEAFRLGVSLVRPGTIGREVHERVKAFFKDAGFVTGPTKEGRMQGFFHGTGHGLGLDVHEPPLYARSETPFAAGMVVTVEPGLYYPGIGGIRIEDDVAVRPEGEPENLVTAPIEFVV